MLSRWVVMQDVDPVFPTALVSPWVHLRVTRSAVMRITECPLSLTICWSLWPQVAWWAYPRGDVRYLLGWSHRIGAGISSRITTWTGRMLGHHLPQRTRARGYLFGIIVVYIGFLP